MVTQKELIYIGVLLKKKMKTLGDSEKDKWRKHNYRIIRAFIENIKDDKIDEYIKKLKKELVELNINIEK